MNILLDYSKPAAIFLFCLTFASFAWAIPKFFRQLSPEPLGLRLIKGLGSAMLVLSAIVHVTTVSVPISLRLAGCGVFGCALFLFWATIQIHRQRPPYLAFSLNSSSYIIEVGPYRHIRHPFYASYCLGWVANVMISASPVLLFPLVCMGALYISAARLEEKQFLSGELSDQYAAYRQRTKMLVPFIW